jgi:glucans biosynthesis protein C
MHQLPKTERIFALDMLRAIMMLLGIVLHSAVTYASTPMPWPIKSPDNHLAFDALVDFIHLFRMPIFFVISGFFAAFLLFERGHGEMIKNRVTRLICPFVVGIFFLFPLATLAGIYSNNSFEETPLNLAAFYTQFINYFLTTGVNTIHLWFLYYLAMFSLMMWALYAAFGKNPHIYLFLTKIIGKFSSSFRSKRIIFLLSTLTFLCLIGMESITVKTSSSFLPDLFTFLTYAIFFCFGWVVYGSNEDLQIFKRNAASFIGIALILLAVKWRLFLLFPILPAYMILPLMAGQALCIWLLVFGITGLFLKYFNTPSAWGRYISDASYWIYLVHLPLALFIPGMIHPLQIGSIGGFLITGFTTGIVCVLTYDLFVRSSLIGKFLNGRRFPRALVKKPLYITERQR